MSKSFPQVMHPVFVVVGYQTSDEVLPAVSISVFFLLKAGIMLKKKMSGKIQICCIDSYFNSLNLCALVAGRARQC